MTEEFGMDEILAQSPEVKVGTVVEGIVVGQTDAYLLVNVGLKQEAACSLKEFSSNLPKVGDAIPVLVLRMTGPEGRPLISWRQARERKNWDKLLASFKNNEILPATVTQKVKGGFQVDIGLDAFMPTSQLDERPATNPNEWIGQKISVMILEMDQESGNVLVSRRRVVEQEKAKKRAVTLEGLKVGQTFKGRVTGLTKFGAFVDIGGVEGLVHVSDLAWSRVDDPKTVVKVGDEIEVKVLKYDASTHRISLGRKQLMTHPWEGIETRFPIGSIKKGKVVSLADFGAFVELEAGIEGLIHLSELSWTERIKDVKTVLKVGQMVDVKITAIDKDKEKISLSLKRTGASPWEDAVKKFPVGSKVEGEVTSIAPFGAFVRIPSGIEALLRTQDISWTEKISSVKQHLKVGDKVNAIVLEANAAQEKMAIGIKQLSGDPLKSVKVGQVVEGQVAKVLGAGLIVRLPSGVEGFVPASELENSRSIFSDRDRKTEPTETKEFKEGETISASVTKINKKDRKVDLSIRRYEKDQERELLKKYSGKNEKLTLGQTTGWLDSKETDDEK